MALGDIDFEKYLESRTANEVPPRILHRYLTAEATIATLRSKCLRFSSPLRFNDPFDTQWDIAWRTKLPEIRARYADQVVAQLTGHLSLGSDVNSPGYSFLQTEVARIAALTESDRSEELTKIRKAILSIEQPDVPKKQDMLRRFRIMSMSARLDSLLMWSHYSDQHRGAVLSLDSSVLERLWKRPVRPVDYSDQLPAGFDPEAWIQHMLFDTPIPEDHTLADKWSLTKARDWEYEREWRFVMIEPAVSSALYTDYPFPADALVSVGVGSRVPKEVAMAIAYAAACVNPTVELLAAQRSPTSFGLDLRPLVG